MTDDIEKALSIFDVQDKQELDFCYSGGTADAVFVAKTLVKAYRELKQNTPKRPTNLLVVRNSPKARQVQEALGDDWSCVPYGAVLAGRRFDNVFIVDQPLSESELMKYRKYIERLELCLKPDSKHGVIELY